MSRDKLMNIKIKFLVLVMLLMQSTSFAQTTLPPPQSNTSADKALQTNKPSTLNDVKLQLEIQKLKREIDSPRIEPWLQFGTFIIALSAAAISFWSAWKSQNSQAQTLKHQLEHQRSERIAVLLNELGSNNNGVRVAAIQALSDYPDTHRFLVNLLKYEHDPHIIDAVIAALQLNPSRSLDILIGSVELLQVRMLLLACQLVSNNMPKQEVAKCLGIDNTTLTRWLDSSRGKRAVEDFVTTLTYRDSLMRKSNEEQIIIERQRVIEQWDKLSVSYKNTLGAIEAVIQSACQANQKHQLKGAYLKGIILDGLNLEGWSFHQCDLRFASFRKTNCNECDFSDAVLDSASFVSARLRNTNFTNAKCKSTSFVRASMARANFSGCKAYNASFVATKGKKASFFGASLVEAKFNGFIGVGVNFKDATLKRADLTNAIMNESIFQNADLRGADLSDLSARRAFIFDTKLAGAIIKKADFSKANFERVCFKNVGEYNGAKFSGVTYNDLEFGDTPEKFATYFDAKSQED
ncbi:pentapeptide repeat-containing protein [Vibrio splendidus]|uniref:pentapeptide repeat-containing protein n=1 Tax=Vibrio splendidus TaxID=29497 RepID=UPI00352EABD3